MNRFVVDCKPKFHQLLSKAKLSSLKHATKHCSEVRIVFSTSAVATFSLVSLRPGKKISKFDPEYYSRCLQVIYSSAALNDQFFKFLQHCLFLIHTFNNSKATKIKNYQKAVHFLGSPKDQLCTERQAVFWRTFASCAKENDGRAQIKDLSRGQSMSRE